MIRNLARQYRFCTSVCRLLSACSDELVVRPTGHRPRKGNGRCVMFHTVTLKRSHSNSWNASDWNIPPDLQVAEKLLRSRESPLVKGRDRGSQSSPDRDASRCEMPQDVPYRGQAQV